MSPNTESNGESAVESDRGEIYSAVRFGFKDAILDVIGTVLLLGFSLIFVFVGVRGLVIETSTAVSIAFVIGGFVLAMVALDFVPFFRD